MVDNAANVFYGIVYFMLFAIPIFGAGAIRSGAPIWLRVAAICGAAVSLSAIFFTIYPIIDVPSPLSFARENHRRDRNRERDWRRDLHGWQETSARLTAVLGNPLQVFRQTARDWNENDLRNIVGMKRSQLVLKRRLPVFADFEKDERFVSRLDFFLPAVNRFDGRQNIRARRKAFAHQLVRNLARDFRVRKCA